MGDTTHIVVTGYRHLLLHATCDKQISTIGNVVLQCNFNFIVNVNRKKVNNVTHIYFC